MFSLINKKSRSSLTQQLAKTISFHLIAIFASSLIGYQTFLHHPLIAYQEQTKMNKLAQKAAENYRDKKQLSENLDGLISQKIKQYPNLYQQIANPLTLNQFTEHFSQTIKFAHLQLEQLTPPSQMNASTFQMTCNGPFQNLFVLMRAWITSDIPITITTAILQKNHYTLTVKVDENRA